MRKRNILIIAIVLMTVGFAAVTTNVVVNGSVTIGNDIKDYDIRFTKTTLDGVENNDLIMEDEKNLKYQINLVGNSSELIYEVTNNSIMYDASVGLMCRALGKEHIDLYTIDTTNTPEIIKANDTGTGSIRIDLIGETTETITEEFECALNLKELKTTTKEVVLNVTEGGLASSSSIDVVYGKTNTFTVTPDYGYYLEDITCDNGYTATGYTTGNDTINPQVVTINNNNSSTNASCLISFKEVKIETIFNESGLCGATSCTPNNVSKSFSGISNYDSSKKEWNQYSATAVGPSFTLDLTSIKRINYNWYMRVGGSYDSVGTIKLVARCGSVSKSVSVSKGASSGDTPSSKTATLTLDVSSLSGEQTCTTTISYLGEGSNINYRYTNTGEYRIIRIYPEY